MELTITCIVWLMYSISHVRSNSEALLLLHEYQSAYYELERHILAGKGVMLDAGSGGANATDGSNETLQSSSPFRPLLNIVAAHKSNHTAAIYEWILVYNGEDTIIILVLIFAIIPFLLLYIFKWLLDLFKPEIHIANEHPYPIVPLCYLQQTQEEQEVIHLKRNSALWLSTRYIITASDNLIDIHNLPHKNDIITEERKRTELNKWTLLRTLARFNGIYTKQPNQSTKKSLPSKKPLKDQLDHHSLKKIYSEDFLPRSISSVHKISQVQDQPTESGKEHGHRIQEDRKSGEEQDVLEHDQEFIKHEEVVGNQHRTDAFQDFLDDYIKQRESESEYLDPEKKPDEQEDRKLNDVEIEISPIFVRSSHGNHRFERKKQHHAHKKNKMAKELAEKVKDTKKNEDEEKVKKTEDEQKRKKSKEIEDEEKLKKLKKTEDEEKVKKVKKTEDEEKLKKVKKAEDEEKVKKVKKTEDEEKVKRLKNNEGNQKMNEENKMKKKVALKIPHARHHHHRNHHYHPEKQSYRNIIDRLMYYLHHRHRHHHHLKKKKVAEEEKIIKIGRSHKFHEN